MMGGPIDARRSPTSVNNLATKKSYEWFENNVIYRVPSNFAGAGRRVYPGFLQHTGFVAMNPDRHMSSHYDYFRDLIRGDGDSADAHRQFYDEYNAVLDMPAEYYLETIKTVFQDFALVNGTWDVHGTLVQPQDIRTSALLTVEGELDDISGAGQTRAAHGLCTGIPDDRKFHYDAVGAGHYGIFSGRRWREMVYPEVKDFIQRHSQAAQQTGQPQPAQLVLATATEQKTAAKATASADENAPAKARKTAQASAAARQPKASAQASSPASHTTAGKKRSPRKA
jgi:poly(3-hydroxybutyrate) depolymerase